MKVESNKKSRERKDKIHKYLETLKIIIQRECPKDNKNMYN